MHREFRKPLIIMTPKSLLRHKKCVSNISEFSKKSTFHRVLEDDAYSEINNLLALKKRDDHIKKVVMCSGKIYYDLIEAREKISKRDWLGSDSILIHQIKFTNKWSSGFSTDFG